MGFVIGLLVFGGYIGLIFALVRWARRRLTHRATLAASALKVGGAEILSITPGSGWGAPATVDYQLDGKRGRFIVRRYGRDYVLLSVQVECHPLPGILIRAESGGDRMGKALGLNREVQLGDPTFDAAAYLVSNAPDDLVRQTLASPDVRRSVTEILALGYRVDMSTRGLRATRLQPALQTFDATPVPAVMRALERLAPLLPKLSLSQLTHPPADRFPRMVIFAGIFSFLSLVSFFATLPFLHPPVNDTDSLKVIGVGLVAWAVVVAILGLSMRARSTGMFELLLSAVALLFGVPIASAGLTFLANCKLDSSAPVTHVTRIVSISRRKNENDVRVVPWDPERTFQKIPVDYPLYKTLKVDDTVAVDVHPGQLGWPWVSEVRKQP